MRSDRQGGDRERGAPVDERHRAQCRCAVAERHGASRHAHGRRYCSHRRAERHRLPGQRGIRRGRQRRGGLTRVHRLGPHRRGADRELEASAIRRRERMTPSSQCGGDERRAAIDERHRAQRGRAVLERHGASRNQRIREHRGHCRRQRHGLTEDRGVRGGIERCRGRRPDVDLADDVGEEIGLDHIDAGPADVGALDAEEIGVGGTPGDGVSQQAIADEPGRRRWGRGRVPREERPSVGRGKDAGEVTGKGSANETSLVDGEIDRPCRRSNKRLGPERTGHDVRRAGNEAVGKDPDAVAREHDLCARTIRGRTRGPAEARLGAHHQERPASDIANVVDGARRAPVEEFVGEVIGKRDRLPGIGKCSHDRARICRVRRVEALSELQAVLVQIPPGITIGRVDGSDRGQALRVLGEGPDGGKDHACDDCQRNAPLQFRSSRLHPLISML